MTRVTRVARVARLVRIVGVDGAVRVVRVVGGGISLQVARAAKICKVFGRLKIRLKNGLKRTITFKNVN